MGRASGRTSTGTGASPRRSAGQPLAHGTRVVVEGAERRAFALRVGVIDDAAMSAYTHGQCHALALALHERTGWPLHWSVDEDGDPGHVYVRDPHGHPVDITGVHDHDEMLDAWGEDEPADADAVAALAAGGSWRVPDLRAARAFVPAVLGLHAAAAQLHPPGTDELPVPQGMPSAPDAFAVLDADGAVRRLPSGRLTAAARDHLAREQSYALAYALAGELGDGWKVGVLAGSDPLATLAVHAGRGVGVGAHGEVPVAAHDVEFWRYRDIRERLHEDGAPEPDFGLAEHYAALIAGQLTTT